MKARLQSFLLAALMAVALTAGPKSAQAQGGNPFENIAVAATSSQGQFAGTLNVIRFVRDGDALGAVVQLTGTVTDTGGAEVRQIEGLQLTVPVISVTGSCTILDLTIGPIDLDLLGLVIETDTIHLEITGETGPGNLLGNLLCAIASLLDGGGPLGDLVGLLNNILRLLG
jgi:hypothetical protein